MSEMLLMIAADALERCQLSRVSRDCDALLRQETVAVVSKGMKRGRVRAKG